MDEKPQRKGLNVPSITHKTPLDLKFEELAAFLEIDENVQEDALSLQYKKVATSGDLPVDNETKIDSLIDASFQYVFTIQKLAADVNRSNKSDSEKANLISISLHDMKHFNDLINFVIIQLIYPLLPIDIGIPLNQRRLKSFNDKSKLYQFQKLRSPKNNQLLSKIVLSFEEVFKKDDDLRDMLIKGTGLIDIITILIVLVHSDPENERYSMLLEYFESQSDTYNLYSIYTLLLQATTNPRYKQFISSKLSSLTITRSNGVISLIDFIIGIRDDEDINIEKFNTVNKILLAVPKSLSKVEYFKSIFGQVYSILVFVDRPVLSSVALNFIKRVYELNKKIVHDFLFRLIWNKLDPKVPDVIGDEILVSEKELNDVINVLISLTKESSVEFLNELFATIFLNLWSYFNYLRKKKLDYHKIILKVLTSLFKITKNNDFMKDIILNLVRFEISDDLKFVTTIENNLSRIQKTNKLIDGAKYSNEDFFNDMEIGLDSLLTLFKEIDDKDLIRNQFLIVLNRWILQKRIEPETPLNEKNPFLILIDLKVLEKINEAFKDSLLDKPEDVLMMIKNILIVKTELKDEEDDLLAREKREVVDSDDEDSDDEVMEDDGNESEDSDNLNVLLELLSAIISETPPNVLKSKHEQTLSEISKLLLSFPSNKYCVSLNSRIRNLLENEIKSEDDPAIEAKLKDKEVLEKALTNMNDPLVPIRAHGLYLLRQLIIRRSPVLSLDMVVDLHLVQLHDTEPFIYLNVIKSLKELLDSDEVQVLPVLMDYYFDRKVDETVNLDDRLKIGEVLLNHIQRKNQLLVSSPVIDELLSCTIQLINDFKADNRLRMSGMSILGESLRTNALGLVIFVKDAVDCAIGILELEKDVTMKRSAVVLINDLVANDIELFPRGYGQKLITLLNFVKMNSNDYLLIEQIDKLLENIRDSVKNRLRLEHDIPNGFKSFQIKDW